MSNLTTAEWLFKVPVAWVVPQYAVLSDWAVKEEGLFLPDEKEVQEAHLSEDIFYMMTTADAAELFAEKQMKIAINDPQQAKDVYEKIMKHLANWRYLLSQPQFVAREIPLEGLREFNELAKVLFNPANRWHYSLRHLDPTATDIRKMLGMSNSEARSDALFNGSIMVDIENMITVRNKTKL